MKKPSHRITSAVCAAALGAGIAVTWGVGPAAAADLTTNWSIGDVSLSRTVNGATFSPGDTITTSVHIDTTGDAQAVTTLKDVHSDCLIYVEGSARVDGEVFTPDLNATSVAFEGYWQFDNEIPNTDRSFSFDYLVTESCAPGSKQTLSLEVSLDSMVSKIFKVDVTMAGGENPPAGSLGSLGSLGSIFGSLG